jgi:hypothetical protein
MHVGLFAAVSKALIAAFFSSEQYCDLIAFDWE